MVRVPFNFDCWRAVEATAADIAAIQAFFEANPEYTLMCDGRAPLASEGREYVETLPPPEFTYRDHYTLLLRDARDEIDGLAAGSRSAHMTPVSGGRVCKALAGCASAW
jgi:hypothetical protein